MALTVFTIFFISIMETESFLNFSYLLVLGQNLPGIFLDFEGMLCQVTSIQLNVAAPGYY